MFHCPHYPRPFPTSAAVSKPKEKRQDTVAKNPPVANPTHQNSEQGNEAEHSVFVPQEGNDPINPPPPPPAVAVEHVEEEPDEPVITLRLRNRTVSCSLENMTTMAPAGVLLQQAPTEDPSAQINGGGGDDDNGITFIGSNRNRAMCVIHPPKVDDHDDADAATIQENLATIREVSRMFASKAMHKEIRRAEAGGDKSLRPIQSKRFEIFVRNAGDKGSKFWDTAVRQRRKENAATCLSATSTSRLLQYAESQARRDPRVCTSPHYDYKFSNFSLIVSYGSVPAQAPHLDLVGPNFQFILVLTDGSPSTNVYDLQEEDRIRLVKDLRQVWNKERLENHDGEMFPSNLVQVMQDSPDIVDFLADYGDVLHSNAFIKAVEKRQDSLPAGTVLSLPGGVMHAGPASSCYRAVLFFSAVPMTKTGPLTLEYNPDTQFGNVLLTGFLTQIVWRAVGITVKDRLYLLRRLAMFIRQADIRTGWERHFYDSPNLKRVVQRMTRRIEYPELDEYLNRMATQDDLVFYHIELVGVKGDFQCVSDSRLHTSWEDGDWKVQVFRRDADGKVLLQYPEEQKEPEKREGDGWEGHESGNHYRLEMNRNARGALFDGTNGRLWDDEGKEIKCFLVEPSKKRKRR